jgi:hypothetical protein
VAISAALGTRSDMRMMQAQMEEPHFIDYEFCNPEDDFWFDYMAASHGKPQGQRQR